MPCALIFMPDPSQCTASFLMDTSGMNSYLIHVCRQVQSGSLAGGTRDTYYHMHIAFMASACCPLHKKLKPLRGKGEGGAELMGWLACAQHPNKMLLMLSIGSLATQQGDSPPLRALSSSTWPQRLHRQAPLGSCGGSVAGSVAAGCHHLC